MNRLYRLLLALGLTGVFSLISYYLLWWLSKNVYLGCRLFYYCGVEMVRNGKVLHFMYGGVLRWSTVYVLLLSLIWILRTNDISIHPNVKHFLFTSWRVRLSAGISFCMSAVGMMFIKMSNPLEQVFAEVFFVVNVAIVLLVVIWFIAKEIYLAHRNGIGPN